MKILQKLIAAFIKTEGRKPVGLELIRLKQKAWQQSMDAKKVIPFPPDRITDWTKPRPTEGPHKADVIPSGIGKKDKTLGFENMSRADKDVLFDKFMVSADQTYFKFVNDTLVKIQKAEKADQLLIAKEIINRKGMYRYLDDKDAAKILKSIDQNIKPVEPKASGGIAGILGETDRVPYQHGSRQPGMERSVNRAAREKVTRDVQNLQQQMAQRGGGDARDYVTQHQLNQIPDRSELIRDLLPQGPSDRHPGTGKMPVFPRIRKSPFANMFLSEHQKRRYLYQKKEEDDLPEGVLELLKKDPNFDFETFKNIGWSMPENVWDKGAQGLRGIYYGDLPEGIKVPMPSEGEPPGERKRNLDFGEWIPGEKEWNPEDIEGYTETTYRTPSGGPTERIWDPEKLRGPTSRTFSEKFFNPVHKEIDLQMRPFKEDDTPMIRNPNEPTSYTDESRMSNVDKARVALHEMRHKKYIENPELWKSQPQWVQDVEMPGTTENIQFRENRVRAPVGHELYNRFLDQRYYPPMRDAGPSEPYFDKILKDLWEPSAKKYEKIINEYDLSPVNLAGGGIAGMLGEPTYSDGGRIGLKKGTKFDPKRRTVLKGIAALATIPFIGKYFKWAKPLAKTSKVLTSVPIKAGVDGMPLWFKPLVNQIIKKGKQVESGMERVIVHSSELPGSKTKLYVTQELDTGNVLVDVGISKHGFKDGHLGQPVRLEYKAAEDIMSGPSDEPFKIGTMDPHVKTKTRKEFTTTDPTHVENIKRGERFKETGKPTKTKEEFWVEEAEFTGGHPENIKFEESAFEKFGSHGSNFDEVEKFATGKIKKKTAKESKKAERAHWVPEGDMASGGRVPMIFGGSPGLKAMWQMILKNISKGQGKKIDKFFPKPTVQDKELLKLGETYDLPGTRSWAAQELESKLEGIDHIIARLKQDKKIIERQAANKAMKDEGLDFLMKQIEQDMPDVYGPHLKKYTNIDKDILQMETIKKNLIMKDRKLNATGGLAGMLGE